MEIGNQTERFGGGFKVMPCLAALTMALFACGCASSVGDGAAGSVREEKTCPLPLSRLIEKDMSAMSCGENQKKASDSLRRYRRDPVSVWSDQEKGRIHALAGAERSRICRRYTGCRGRNREDQETLRILAGGARDPKGHAPSFRIRK